MPRCRRAGIAWHCCTCRVPTIGRDIDRQAIPCDRRRMGATALQRMRLDSTPLSNSAWRAVALRIRAAICQIDTIREWVNHACGTTIPATTLRVDSDPGRRRGCRTPCCGGQQRRSRPAADRRADAGLGRLRRPRRRDGRPRESGRRTCGTRSSPPDSTSPWPAAIRIRNSRSRPVANSPSRTR